LAGNVFVLTGSVLLFGTIVHKRSALFAATIVAAILFVVRLIYFPPAPYMREGILVFNTSFVVGVAYAVLFIGIWLPANLSVGRAVGSRAGVPEFTKLLQGLFGLSVIAAIFMPFAQMPAVIAGSFATLVVCYAVLIIVNMSLRKRLV
jgi:hypothetical protein